MWKNHQSRGWALSLACSAIVFLILLYSGSLKAQGVSGSDTASAFEQSELLKSDSVLITNVYLVGIAGAENDVLANLLIIDGKLKVVTRDEIRASETRITVDAKNGFLMGNLLIGDSPSFLILDQNPRENYEIYLNTEAHLLFAMEKGVIVRNNLEVTVLTEDVQQQKGG